MNINAYKHIDYTDNEPHRATVAEHIASLAQDLREFCATHTEGDDFAYCGDAIQETGETLNALDLRNRDDIITIIFNDWSGYIINDETETN